MTVHRFHPSDADPEDAFLYDDCERCAEHAEQLTSLDSSNAARLVRRVLEAEIGTGYYRTHAEALAGRNLFHGVLVLERATGRSVREILS